MKSTIKLFLDGVEIPVNIFRFSGGEMQVRVDFDEYYEVCVNNFTDSEPVIYANIRCSDGIMATLLLADALEKMDVYKHRTIMPYLPYARQDRVCSPGEADASDILAEVVLERLAEYKKVVCADIHSKKFYRDYAVVEYEQWKILDKILESLKNDYCGRIGIICPDKGAVPKITNWAVATQNKHPIYYCTKKRDPYSGILSGFEVNETMPPVDFGLVVDDICDGGGTFIGLGEKLKEAGWKKLGLYITHGIFSKGLDDLFKIYDHIITTDTFYSPNLHEPRLIGPDTLRNGQRFTVKYIQHDLMNFITN